MLRRLPLVLPALAAGALAAAACSSPSSTTGAGGIAFTMALPPGSTPSLAPGASTSLTLHAANISASGTSSSPEEGTVTLTVTPSTGGTLSASSVALGPTGVGSVSFEMCLIGPTCIQGHAVTISASVTLSGTTYTSSVNLAIGAPTVVPSLQLTLTAPAGTSPIQAEGAAVPITITAVQGLADGGTAVPMSGTVQLSGVNGDPSAASVALDSTGTGTASFTLCTSGPTCAAGATAALTAILTLGNLTATQSLDFTLSAPTCAGGSCGADGGTGGTGSPSLLVTEADLGGNPIVPTAIPAGTPWIAVIATVATATGTPAVDVPVTFTINPAVNGGSIGGFLNTQPPAGAPDAGAGAASSVSATTSGNGAATVFFVPSALFANGSFTVSATPPSPDGGSGAADAGAAALTVVVPVHVVGDGSIAFTPLANDAYNQVMGVQTSGYNETSVLRFTVLDAYGVPVANPASVTFTASALGGATISPANGQTDMNGQVVTTLSSGRVPGTIVVTAVAVLDSGPTVTTTTPAIVVVGAKASASNFTVSCNKRALNALYGNDCVHLQADLSATCTAAVSDRFNNALGVSVTLSWMSEAGFFGPPSTTPSATAGADPTTELALGRSSNVLQTLSSRLPLEVDNLPTPNGPQPGEPTHLVTTACGTRTAGPRDGLVTFITITQGEEGFVDSNGNGVYDQGEQFFDLGEPFVDENDNNKWDEGEPFMDLNGDGLYTPANGKWDSNTTIWTEGHIVFTDAPQLVTTAGALEPVVTPASPYSFPATSVPTSENYTVRWEDENRNQSAPAFTTYASSVAGLGTFLQTSPAQPADSFGSMHLTQNVQCVGLPCQNNIVVAFDQAPSDAEQVGVYLPPNSTVAPAGFDDSIEFSVTLTDVNVTVQSPPQSVEYTPECDTSNIPTSVNCSLVQCAEKPCTVGSSTGTCVNQACTTAAPATSNWQVSLGVFNLDGTPSSLRAAAGSATLEVVVTVTDNGAAPTVATGPVTISVPNGTIGKLSVVPPTTGTVLANSITVAPNAEGIAIAYLVPASSLVPLTGDLQASFTTPTAVAGPDGGTVLDGGSVPAQTITVQNLITIFVPGTLSFTPLATDAFYTVMGVKNSGFREQNTFRFTLFDSSGVPYVGPATINFQFANLPAGEGLGGATIVPSSISTDANGQAVTTVYSGTAAGTLAVVATATFPPPALSVSGTSETVAVIGAKGNGRNFAVVCDHAAEPALVGNDCTYMHADLTSTCTAVIGDRYNNVLGTGVEVSWLSEAGLFGPPSATPAALPGADPTSEPALGRTSNTLRTLNAVMPIDVAPATGEPHWSTTTDLCSPPVNNVPQTRTHNPRDGLVTFIAATQGEEGFTDLNGNGQWDQGEPFFDLGEPYADSNDNNEWDPGEPYIDVNGNGQYDGPNGKWDSNTTIWTVGHVMYTDAPNAWWFDAAGALVTKLPSVDDGSSEPFSVEWRDDNLNVSAPAFATYTLGLVAPAGGSVALTGLPAFVDSFGSVGVGAPTTCVTPGTSPICSQSTEIQFFDPYSTDLNLPMSSFDMVEGLYTAPAAAMMGASPAGTDTIEATALTTVGTGVVTVISTETVDFSGGP